MAVEYEQSSSSRAKRAKLSHSPPPAEDEHEAYYCANFKQILNYVLHESMDGHVISEAGVQTVQRFMQLQGSEQLLFVRLYLRKHQWLRASKLSYPDIAPSLTPLLHALVEHSLLKDESSITGLHDGLALLQVPELRMVCKEFNLPSSLTGKPKSVLIESIIEYCKQHRPIFGSARNLQTTIFKRVKSLLGYCVMVCPAVAKSLSQIVLIFSLSTTGYWLLEDDNDIQRIVYRMLEITTGQRVCPQYHIKVTQPLFATTEQFTRFYEAVQLEQRVMILLEERGQIEETEVTEITELATKMLADELEPVSDHLQSQSVIDLTVDEVDPFLIRYRASWVCARTLSRCVEVMERMRRYDRACDVLELLLRQQVYCNSRRGLWWERLTLDLDHHLKQRSKCLQVIKKALSDPHLHDSRRLALLQRAHRICQTAPTTRERKRRTARNSSCYTLADFPPMELTPYNEVTLTGHLQPQTCTFIVQKPGSTALMPVEDFAIHHYTTVDGWSHALHAEGVTFSTLYLILFWDIVYSELPNVFRAPYQSIPLDFGTKEFYHNRKDLIESRISWIREADMEELSSAVETSWLAHSPEECPGVHWDLFPNDCSDAKSLAECMGGALLANICHILSCDYRGNRGGLPDLTLWNPSNRQCKFVEVKGPTDRLSHTQTIWLSRLASWGSQVEVCWVKAVKD